MKLYPVLDAATSALTTDPELASLRGLYELVRGLREIPTERVRFLTAPRKPYVADANRDQLSQPEAEALFERLRRDASVTVAQEAAQGPGTGTDSGAPSGNSDDGGTDSDGKVTRGEFAESSGPSSPAPTFSGNTAAEDGCA